MPARGSSPPTMVDATARAWHIRASRRRACPESDRPEAAEVADDVNTLLFNKLADTGAYIDLVRSLWAGNTDSVIPRRNDDR